MRFKNLKAFFIGSMISFAAILPLSCCPILRQERQSPKTSRGMILFLLIRPFKKLWILPATAKAKIFFIK